MGAKNYSKYKGKFVTGHKFGHWTVIDGKIHSSPAHMDVRCECGTVKRTDVYSLVKGRSTNCGCKKSQLTGSSAPNWNGVGNIPATPMYRALLKAERSAPVSINYHDMANAFQSQSGKCSLTGHALTLTANSSNAELTRINPNGSYTPDNIQWVHTSIAPIASAVGTQVLNAINNSVTSTSTNIFDKLGFKPTVGDK